MLDVADHAAASNGDLFPLSGRTGVLSYSRSSETDHEGSGIDGSPGGRPSYGSTRGSDSSPGGDIGDSDPLPRRVRIQ